MVEFVNKKLKIVLAISIIAIAVISVYFSAFYLYTGSLPIGSSNLTAEEWNSHTENINRQVQMDSDKTWHLFYIYPQIRITNNGNGIATNIQVRYEASGGQIEGDSKKIENAQSLNAGESETATTYFSTGWLPDWESYPTYILKVTVYIGNTEIKTVTIRITPPIQT